MLAALACAVRGKGVGLPLRVRAALASTAHRAPCTAHRAAGAPVC